MRLNRLGVALLHTPVVSRWMLRYVQAHVSVGTVKVLREERARWWQGAVLRLAVATAGFRLLRITTPTAHFPETNERQWWLICPPWMGLDLLDRSALKLTEQILLYHEPRSDHDTSYMDEQWPA